VFSVSSTAIPIAGIFVGIFVDRAFADKVFDKVSDKGATRKW
jgi:hypothetical protein